MPDESRAVVVTAENFESAVVETSKTMPVIVDFWAPWCGPCRQLGPLLDKLAEEFAGRFRLAKVNTEEAPDLAAAFGVSSIPFVVALRDGQITDQFVGLLPEPQLREWITRQLPTPVDTLLAKGRELEANDAVGAESAYREAAALAPGDDRVRIALARVLLALDRDEEAATLIETLAARGYLEPEAETLQSQLALRAAAAETGGIEEAERAVADRPDDLELKIRLGDVLAVAGQHQRAMDVLLDVIRADRSGHGEAARESMVRIFDLLGPQNPLVSEYRRKLATALY